MTEVKVTCILGPQAEAISNALRYSGVIIYRDSSVPGMKILDVYTETGDKEEVDY